ncbi:Uu.00g030650.m01.CDS01 [Anthostomella pinea]|uniref:Uu.00g030650.m01.CDS01 n=1 Tax=Anthostomella pinea TaxID=933095 RepID=A0AAI8V8U4_9PEZI|nr:Uu.00g030650.m01.CDS01 [Anthostomella pinea]
MLGLGILKRSQLSPLKRHVDALRSAVVRPSPRTNLQLSFTRFESSTAKKPASTGPAPKPTPPKLAYPERLCVYHAGTGRVTFLACLKLSTLFIFAFFGFVVTPSYFEREGLSTTVARTTFSAIIPLVFVAYTTSPFVTFIHIRLPPFARQSEDMLRRFVRTLPPQTELDITTMSFIAKPRLSTVKMCDLKPASKRLGIVNMFRDTTAENATRRWYMFPAVGNFNVQSNQMPKVGWVWESMHGAIARQR